jgi:excisionase family DNA binding protein
MEEKLYRGSEVASILNISRALAYRLLAEGAIPSIRFGRTVRCRPEDLENFIKLNLTSNDRLNSHLSGLRKESVI